MTRLFLAMLTLFFLSGPAMGKMVISGAAHLLTGVELNCNIGGEVGCQTVGLYDGVCGNNHAETIYGAQSAALRKTTQQTLSLLYNLGGSAGSVITSADVSESLAEAVYGDAHAPTMGLFQALTGGEGSAAYRTGYTGTMAASIFLGNRKIPMPGRYSAAATMTLDASAIRLSQSNVRSSLPEITASMRANRWQWRAH